MNSSTIIIVPTKGSSQSRCALDVRIGCVHHVTAPGILDQAARLSDRFAPEHLELQVERPEPLADQIQHAGAIFLGKWTPEAIGDYVGGPNHVLPTARSARFSSGLSVMDFLKRTTLAKMSPGALAAIGPAAETLATAESLGAHGLSVRLRLDRLNEGG